MRIFAKPKPEVKDEQVVKSDESKGTSESEGITVFKDERKRKGSVPNKSKDRNASEHR